MGKSWDTLFHLSGFMKYLLYEVLPREDTNCPQYILDSLFELLNITLECIQFIKSKCPPSSNSQRKNFHSMVENVATQSLVEINGPISSGQQKAGGNDRTVEQQEFLKSDKAIPSGGRRLHDDQIKTSSNERTTDPPPKRVNELALSLNSAVSLKGLVRHHSVILKKNFLFLNEQIISGDEEFGSYCLPCDKCFFTPGDWGEHLNYDVQHHNISDNSKCVESKFCEKCNFVVFGNLALTDVYLDYHVISFHDDTKKGHRESIPETDSRNIKTPNYYKHFSCGACKKNFVASEEWNRHLSEFHPELCKISTSQPKRPAINNNNNYQHSNLQATQSMSQSEDKLSMSSNQSNRDKRSTQPEVKKRGEYTICQTFIDLNSDIHKNKHTGLFYCRPCDTGCSHPEVWASHCRKEKHRSYMTDTNFKNFEVVCEYCDLRFVGSDRTVKEYMKYHSGGHGKVPSYDVVPVQNDDVVPVQNDNEAENIQKKRKRKKAQRNGVGSMEKLCDSNNENFSINESQESSTVPLSRSSTSSSHLGTEKISNLQDQNSESNWYTSSRDEEIINNIKNMFLLRKKEKVSGKISSFGGYCIICEMLICDAFDWMDHISTSEHVSRISKGDEDVQFSEFNLNIFGNKEFIKNIRSTK